MALPSKPPETNAQALLINALPEKSPIMLDLATSLAKLTTEGSGNIRSIDTKGSKGMKPWPEVVSSFQPYPQLDASLSYLFTLLTQLDIKTLPLNLHH